MSNASDDQASVDLPDWPEKEEFDAGIDFSGLHGV
jgi:hypothetical protein